jgi:putative SOS response-associated peptidase YedK
VVGPIHQKAMPVILREDDWETWLTADARDAARLQRPWPNDELQIVARGLLEWAPGAGQKSDY